MVRVGEFRYHFIKKLAPIRFMSNVCMHRFSECERDEARYASTVGERKRK